jgi:hypothetical protein
MKKNFTYTDLSPDLQEAYAWLDPISKTAPLAWVGTGKNKVLRFKANRAIVFMYNMKGCDMNDIWRMAIEAKWSTEDVMSLYRQIGYSLSGFGEVFTDERMRRKTFK